MPPPLVSGARPSTCTACPADLPCRHQRQRRALTQAAMCWAASLRAGLGCPAPKCATLHGESFPAVQQTGRAQGGRCALRDASCPGLSLLALWPPAEADNAQGNCCTRQSDLLEGAALLGDMVALAQVLGGLRQMRFPACPLLLLAGYRWISGCPAGRCYRTKRESSALAAARILLASDGQRCQASSTGRPWLAAGSPCALSPPATVPVASGQAGRHVAWRDTLLLPPWLDVGCVTSCATPAAAALPAGPGSHDPAGRCQPDSALCTGCPQAGADRRGQGQW